MVTRAVSALHRYDYSRSANINIPRSIKLYLSPVEISPSLEIWTRSNLNWIIQIAFVYFSQYIEETSTTVHWCISVSIYLVLIDLIAPLLSETMLIYCLLDIYIKTSKLLVNTEAWTITHKCIWKHTSQDGILFGVSMCEIKLCQLHHYNANIKFLDCQLECQQDFVAPFHCLELPDCVS